MEVNRLAIASTIVTSALIGFFLAAVLGGCPAPPFQQEWPLQNTQNTQQNTQSIQCPIPFKDRVPNRTGIQCVFSSIETLGRWIKIPALVNPPLTSRPECQGYSNPFDVGELLTRLGVRYDQSYFDSIKGKHLIKKAMRESRGALFGVKSKGKKGGHAMVMVHYDEFNDEVLYFDNSDKELRICSMSINEFEKTWDKWILVIYADRLKKNCYLAGRL